MLKKMVCLVFNLLFLFSLAAGVSGEEWQQSVTVNPPSKFPPLPDEPIKLVSSHFEPLKKLVFLSLHKMSFMLRDPKEIKPWTLSSRKLSSIDPFPARPTPLLQISHSPLHSSVGFSVPANVAKSPQPPQPQTPSPPLQLPSPQPRTAAPPLQLPSPHAHLLSPSPPKIPSPTPKMLSPQPRTASPPPPPAPETQPATPPQMSFTPTPENPPFSDDAAPPPSPFTLPPCLPIHEAPASAPESGMVHNNLWCVAKPTVPSDTLQMAIDYACGDGGADCKEIMPDGNCYSPDSVVAHASYAFNSYWQKNKRTGGTCGFDGTAMLINNDPSYLPCRFVLT